MTAQRPLAFADITPMLSRLGDRIDIVLVGGQALNFWCEYFMRRTAPQLEREAPYTSKDIDFLASRSAVGHCARLLDGTATLPEPFDPTPSSGVVAYKDESGQDQYIDFVRQVYGVDETEIRETAVRADVHDARPEATSVPLRVMHPVLCMESRAANVVDLIDYQTDHGRKQARASVYCAHRFVKLLADEGLTRNALKLCERIFRFASQKRVGPVLYHRERIDPFLAVRPLDSLPADFSTKRYPQMQRMLATQRLKRQS